jgi:hypothetical protein
MVTGGGIIDCASIEASHGGKQQLVAVPHLVLRLLPTAPGSLDPFLILPLLRITGKYALCKRWGCQRYLSVPKKLINDANAPIECNCGRTEVSRGGFFSLT